MIIRGLRRRFGSGQSSKGSPASRLRAAAVEALEPRRLLTAATDVKLLTDLPKQQIEIAFDSSPPALAEQDIGLVNLSRWRWGQVVFDVDRSTSDAIYLEPTQASGSRYFDTGGTIDYLPNGNFEVLIEEAADPTLDEDFTGEFYFMRGDLDGDRAITLTDSALLERNFGSTNAVYSQGDVNYDGVIDLDDRDYLQSIFSTQLSPAPESVGEITVDSLGEDTVRVNWIGDPASHTSYRIYRSDDGVNFNTIVANPTTADLNLANDAAPVTWVDTTAEPGKKYWYRIRGYHPDAGFSHTTDKDWAVTTLPTPSNVQGSEPNDYEIELTWDPVHANADHVVIWASFDGGIPEVWTHVDAAETSYTFGSDFEGDVELSISVGNSEDGATSAPRFSGLGRTFRQALGGHQGFTFGYVSGSPGTIRGVSVSPAPPPANPPGPGGFAQTSLEPIEIEPGQSKTFTFSNLPEHAEASVGVGRLDTHVVGGGSPPTITYTIDGLGHNLDNTSATPPTAHSGSTASITVTNTTTLSAGDDPEDFILEISSAHVSIWTPIVGIAVDDGELTENEDDHGSVRLSRWGDNQLTPITSQIRVVGGSATLNEDYDFAGGSVSIAAQSAHSSPKSVEERDDFVAEGLETIQLAPTDGPGFVLARPARVVLTIVDPEPTLIALKVVEGATQSGVDTAKHPNAWATVKDEDEYVILEATVSNADGLADGQLSWTGGEQVPDEPLKRRVARGSAERESVTVELGEDTLSKDIWIVWANGVVRTDGQRSTDNDAPNQWAISDGGDWLGPLNNDEHNNALDPPFVVDEIINKIEIVFTLEPPGVGNVVPEGWDVFRTRTGKEFVNGQINGDDGNFVDKGDDDVDTDEDLDPAENNKLYSLDSPGFFEVLDHTQEQYINFKERVLWNGSRASDDVLWHSHAAVDGDQPDDDNTDVQLLGVGHQPIPDQSRYQVR